MADRHDDVIAWAGNTSDPSNYELPPNHKPPPAPSPTPGHDTPPPATPPKREPPPPKRTAALGSSGLVCGRFLPPHRGHQYVIEVARASVAELRVLVFASPADPIPGALRVRWLRELNPGVAIELVERDANAAHQAPGHDELVRAVGSRAPGYLFASELAYATTARALGATFVPVDPARAVIPTSGTAIRADVLRHFHMLPEALRPWFVRRVLVVGAESTGKTALCAQLAAAYDTLHVPEYARTLAESRGGELDDGALALAARGQLASEDALARSANRVMFCDTDVRTPALWCERLYGHAPAWAHAQADARPYDLVIATSLDEPFSGRAARDRPAERREFHARVLAAYAPTVVLHGDRAARLAQARAAIDELLARPGLLGARHAHCSASRP